MTQFEYKGYTFEIYRDNDFGPRRVKGSNVHWYGSERSLCQEIKRLVDAGEKAMQLIDSQEAK